MFRVILGLVAVVWTAQLAAQPQLYLAQPWAVARGQDVEFHFYGSDLRNPQSLLWYGSGVEVGEIKSVDPNHVTARCRVLPDAPLGAVAVRVCVDSGITNLRQVIVAAVPTVDEVEPNQDAVAGQPIAFPATVMGTLQLEDTDVFTFDVEKGQRISIEVEGLRLGYEFFDPCVKVYGPAAADGQEHNSPGPLIAEADDSTLTRQDPYLVAAAPATGRYTIALHERTWEGNDRCRYVLHVGSFPRPSAVLPGGGPANAELSLTAVGPDEGATSKRTETANEALSTDPSPVSFTAKLPGEPRERWPWLPADDGGTTPTPIQLSVTNHPNSMESEPNNSHPQATPTSLPTTLVGTIQPADDHDLFRFSAKKDEVWAIRSIARDVMRSPLDAVVRIHQAGGAYLTAADDSATGADAFLEFTVPADGDYLVEVLDHLRRGGPEYVYRVDVVPRAPGLQLLVPDRIYNTTTTLPVCQGNRMAVMVQALRSYCDGPVTVSAEGLPSGVTATIPPIVPGRDQVPFFVEAAADAPFVSGLVPLRGTVPVGEVAVAGVLRQRTLLAIGMNNRDMWGHDSDRLACSVVRPAPVKLEVVAPKAPLTRNGEKALIVRATRDASYTAAMQVQLLFHPPGVSSPGTVTLGEGQSEVAVPITANGGASIGEWPLVLVGQGVHEEIRFEVATQLAAFTIEDYYFDLAWDKASVEQGGASELVMHITPRLPVPEPTIVELVALPPGVTSVPQTLEPGKTELRFPLTASNDAQVGRFPSILCRMTTVRNGESIVQTLGTGQIRVDPQPTTQPLGPTGS